MFYIWHTWALHTCQKRPRNRPIKEQKRPRNRPIKEQKRPINVGIPSDIFDRPPSTSLPFLPLSLLSRSSLSLSLSSRARSHSRSLARPLSRAHSRSFARALFLLPSDFRRNIEDTFSTRLHVTNAKFSKVSNLLDLLWKGTIESTFENLCAFMSRTPFSSPSGT
jgi:hypothetical protein